MSPDKILMLKTRKSSN